MRPKLVQRVDEAGVDCAFRSYDDHHGREAARVMLRYSIIAPQRFDDHCHRHAQRAQDARNVELEGCFLLATLFPMDLGD